MSSSGHGHGHGVVAALALHLHSPASGCQLLTVTGASQVPHHAPSKVPSPLLSSSHLPCAYACTRTCCKAHLSLTNHNLEKFITAGIRSTSTSAALHRTAKLSGHHHHHHHHAPLNVVTFSSQLLLLHHTAVPPSSPSTTDDHSALARLDDFSPLVSTTQSNCRTHPATIVINVTTMFRTAMIRSAAAAASRAVARPAAFRAAASPFVAKVAAPAPKFAALQTVRMYSAASGLNQQEVEGRIIGILNGFDKVSVSLTVLEMRIG